MLVMGNVSKGKGENNLCKCFPPKALLQNQTKKKTVVESRTTRFWFTALSSVPVGEPLGLSDRLRGLRPAFSPGCSAVLGPVFGYKHLVAQLHLLTSSGCPRGRQARQWVPMAPARLLRYSSRSPVGFCTSFVPKDKGQASAGEQVKSTPTALRNP